MNTPFCYIIYLPHIPPFCYENINCTVSPQLKKQQLDDKKIKGKD